MISGAILVISPDGTTPGSKLNPDLVAPSRFQMNSHRRLVLPDNEKAPPAQRRPVNALKTSVST